MSTNTTIPPPPTPSSTIETSTKLGTNNFNHTHKPTATQQQLYETLAQYRAVGNVKGALTLVRKAQENNTATSTMYSQLLKILNSTPLDIDTSALVASWFYSPDYPLPPDVKNNWTVWHQVLKLGFRLAPTYRNDDMRALVESFTGTFDLATLTDDESWGLLLRAYGILGKKDRITELISKLTTEPQYAHIKQSYLQSYAALAYASTGSYQEVDNLVELLKQNGNLDEKLLQKIARAYGFKGDVPRTQHYVELCNTLYPESGINATLQMIAHKSALINYYHSLVKSRGVRGLPLKPTNSPELNNLHASWDALMAQNEGKLDNITQCNIILEYLTTANRIDPHKYPISKAKKIVDEYMPAHGIKPDEMTWKTLLIGYATTHEFKNDTKQSTRLDKALVILSRMDEAGFHADQSCFHALFKACSPYLPGKGYLFEHFFLSSQLTTALRFRPNLDPRIFELEEIMMASKIPHDRVTIKLMLTALGATGKYKAMWKRWRLLKLSGLQRDAGLYQLIFSLASLDPEQSQYALSVTRNELSREISHERIPRNTLVAMLDCAVTAQMPDVATLIIGELRRQDFTLSSSSSTSTPASTNSADTVSSQSAAANSYVPLLRACSAIPELASEVPKLLNEMKSKQITYNDSIWKIVMSHNLLHDDAGADIQSIQRTFNDFTMQRFEQRGKIPIPVRQSSPIIPFPSGPYSNADRSMINMYVASLVDAQDVSLVFDVLRTMEKETEKIDLTRATVRGVIKLARQEKSTTELSWLVHQILPRLSSQNSEFKQWIKHLQATVPK
ncbi:hypothetical protein BCR42DRAFT_325011 [Absidia repens]|uniref:Uncharacterized protein n=1 Tax=Absidia repens TaxID=90262 RepID=A0A1X2ILQ3_9FUNG|nr:hypothetical protein BCR42DRAFT_325011 [Absidia repens]